MPTRSLDHVSVRLNGSSTDERVFPQAMDWAFRLNLPLRAFLTNSRTDSHPDERQHRHIVEKMEPWVEACAQRGIVLGMCLSLEVGNEAMDQFLSPHGLCLFVENASSPIERELLLRSARNREIAVLMCPPMCVPMTRFMVLHYQTNPNAVYLESAARLCKALEIHPIILVVADTEREADLQQGYAEAVCKSLRLQADFDLVLGSDLRSAVGRVASWRNCSHLIIERRTAPSWWHFTSGDLLEHLRGLSESVSILALPESATIDTPMPIRGNSSKLPIGYYAEANSKSNQEYV